MLVAGGTSNQNKTLSSASLLDLSDPSQGWIQVGDMGRERHDAAMVVMGDTVLIIGGYNDQFADSVYPLDTVESFDINKKTWTTLNIRMKESRAGHSAVVINTQHYNCGLIEKP